MKINQEQFNKLSQLDRIEFRQKEYKIRHEFKVGLSHEATWFSLLAILFTATLSVMLRQQGRVVASDNLFNIMPLIIMLCIMYITFALLVDIYEFIMKRKNLNELEEKYFKVEVKNATKSR